MKHAYLWLCSDTPRTHRRLAALRVLYRVLHTLMYALYLLLTPLGHPNLRPVLVGIGIFLALLADGGMLEFGLAVFIAAGGNMLLGWLARQIKPEPLPRFVPRLPPPVVAQALQPLKRQESPEQIQGKLPEALQALIKGPY